MSSLGVTIQSYHRGNGSKDSQDRVVTIGDRSDRALVFSRFDKARVVL